MKTKAANLRALLIGAIGGLLVCGVSTFSSAAEPGASIQEYPVPKGSHPHDVAPAPDGTVWYSAQGSGELGRLDPATGQIRRVKLGDRSSPHGVIIGPDGAPWITDGGLNAIVRVDPTTEKVSLYPLPIGREGANLNTAAFDRRGVVWFTGQSGIFGRLDPKIGRVEVFDAPKGPGPYGIAATPDGTVYYASLAGSYIARLDPNTGAPTVIEPPTRKQGARRVWTDSQGHLWVSEWNAGQVGRYDPVTHTWNEWRLPGKKPGAYAVYVNDQDKAGSATSVRTPWCASIRKRRSSSPFRYQPSTLRCASSWVGMAKSGGLSRAPTSSSWSGLDKATTSQSQSPCSKRLGLV